MFRRQTNEILCELCKKVGLSHESFKEHDIGYQQHLCIYRHHKTYGDLIKSAAQGCEACALFRPFIEHAQLRNAGLVQTTESDYSDSELGDITYGYADPFLTETEGEASEEDLGASSGDNEVGEDPDHDRADVEIVSEGSHRSFDFPQDTENKTREVLKWLFLTASDLTGPEHLWLTAESENRDRTDRNQPSESLTTLTLSAGPTPEFHTRENDSDYCLDSRYIGSRPSLAVELPGLWKWPRKALNIRAVII